jgi:GTPase involved in cell partitioning and DNA repair
MSGLHEKAPWDQFTILHHELGTYSPHLLAKNVIIVGNKSDIKGAFLNYEEFKKRTGHDPIMVSAKESEGLEHLVLKMRQLIIDAAPEQPADSAATDPQ